MADLKQAVKGNDVDAIQANTHALAKHSMKTQRGDVWAGAGRFRHDGFCCS
jgi:hypothetical protein